MDIPALQEKLHQACEDGDSDAVRQILMCENINDNNNDMMKEILLHKNINGQSGLHLVCTNSALNITIVNQVINVIFECVKCHELLYELVSMQDNDKITILHLVCENKEKIMIWGSLLKPIQNLTSNRHKWMKLALLTNSDNNTFLHLACKQHNCDIFHFIFNHVRKDIKRLMTAQNNDRRTLLHMACDNTNPDITKLILYHITTDTFKRKLFMTMTHHDHDQNTSSILHTVCRHDNLRMLKEILNHVKNDILLEDMLMNIDERGRTALHLACFWRRSCVSKYIFSFIKGKDDLLKKVMMAQSNDGLTMLHEACSNPTADITNLILDHVTDDTLMRELFMTTTDQNTSILYTICKSDNARMLEVILAHVNDDILEDMLMYCDKLGRTALHLACLQGHNDIIKHLIRLPACILTKLVDIRNNKGMTPIDAMVEYRHFHCLPTLLGGPYELSETIVCSTEIGSILRGACHDGDKSAAESIMVAAYEVQKHKQASMLSIFHDADSEGKQVLHIACSRGDVEILSCILHHLWKMGARNADVTQHYIDESDDDYVSIQCMRDKDNKGRTAFHKCCQLGNYRLVQMMCDAIPKHDHDLMTFILCNQDNKKTSPLSSALENCHHKTVKAIIAMAVKVKCLRKMLLECKNSDKTLLHQACTCTCKYKPEQVLCLEVVLKKAFEYDDPSVFRDLYLSSDEYGRTFLYYLNDSSQDVIQSLLRWAIHSDHQHSARDKQQSICYQLLHRDSRLDSSDTCGAFVSADSATIAKIYTEEAHAKSSNAGVTALEYIQQKQDPTLSTTISRLGTIFDHYHDNMKSDDVRMQQPSDFVLFETKREDGERLLRSMCDLNCLHLIQHEYTQQYLHACWEKYGRYFFFTNMILYTMVLLMLTTFVVSHRFDVNGTSNTDLAFTKASWTHPVAIVLILFSLLTLVYEILQMIAKRYRYFSEIHNYVDLIVCLTSLCLPISSLLIHYNMWQHRIGAIVMCLAWVNATWMITRVPSKDDKLSGKILRKIILVFNMLFHVMRRGCLVLPVFAILTLTFALCFHTLFQTQEPFSNIGNSLLRTIGMTIGELDMVNMFFLDSESESLSFKAISCILFTIFLYMMTISAMNLLVGMAVGDINELSDKGEVIAFTTLVELILESQTMLSILKKYI